MQTATIYNHETVVMDGESFSDCEFRDSRLVYSGGQGLSLTVDDLGVLLALDFGLLHP